MGPAFSLNFSAFIRGGSRNQKKGFYHRKETWENGDCRILAALPYAVKQNCGVDVH